MSWHADDATLTAYATGAIGDADAFSLETHLLACPHCRERCARVITHDRLEDAWTEIVDGIDRPRVRPIERLLTWLGVPSHAARLIGATPSLQASWLLAVFAALGFAVTAAHNGPTGMVVFLTIAPLVPLAGVAAAYGPGIDPSYEIGVASPMRGFRLLLLRASAVLLMSTSLIGIAALALPRLDWTAAAWLLPASALTASGLALSTLFDPMKASGAIAFLWIASITTVERISSARLAAFQQEGQIVFLTLTVIGGIATVAMRARFDSAHHRQS